MLYYSILLFVLSWTKVDSIHSSLTPKDLGGGANSAPTFLKGYFNYFVGNFYDF